MTQLNTRVRFHEQGGHLVTREFIAGDKLVKLVLDRTNETLQVLDDKNNTVLLEDHKGKSLASLKRLAKEALKTVGVVFYEETRITQGMKKEDSKGFDFGQADIDGESINV